MIELSTLEGMSDEELESIQLKIERILSQRKAKSDREKFINQMKSEWKGNEKR